MIPALRFQRAIGLAGLLVGFCLAGLAPVGGQASDRNRLRAFLEPAPEIRFPSTVDSNSPAFWRFVRGQRQLAVLNSAPDPVLSTGGDVATLAAERVVAFTSPGNGARWIEAIVPDAFGRLYGYYHNEPDDVCAGRGGKTAPRIGAAKSIDGGRTWVDLGVVVEATGEPDCGTTNRYFSGGVGDFSVVLDRTGDVLYILFSSYGPARAEQGVSIGRLDWANRDRPRGRVAIWSAGVWRYPEAADAGWSYPPPSPILPAAGSWHRPRGNTDAFWGPSVHWNTYLGLYVMLLNRAVDAAWTQGGVYMSTSSRIDDPASWSAPLEIVRGGRWYPQVIGLEPGVGTDRIAGERARFFMGGVSSHEIVFRTTEGPALPRP